MTDAACPHRVSLLWPEDILIDLLHPQTVPGHLCARVMNELLCAISGENKVHSDTLEDLAIVLKRALFEVSLEIPGCRFCPNVDQIIGYEHCECISGKFIVLTYQLQHRGQYTDLDR